MTVPQTTPEQLVADETKRRERGRDGGSRRRVVARPELADAALHGLAGDVVRGLDPYTEADRVAVLVTTLVTFGALVGPSPYVPVGGTRHGPRLFGVLVGETARSRKGTADADVEPIFVAADESVVRIKLGGFGSGEAVVDAVRDADPGEETDDRRDRRLLIHEAEFSRVLRVSHREGSTLSEVIRHAWDGKRLESRTRKSGITTATGTHIAATAHITAEELRRELTVTDTANGFANRFLFSFVRRSKRLPEGGELPGELIADLGRQVRERLAVGRRRGKFTRTPAAAAAWADWYASVDDEVHGLRGHLSARAEAQVLRLQLLYALLDGADVIDVEHVQAAIALWDYCTETIAFIWSEPVTGDPIADRLYAALVAAGERGLDSTEQHHLFGRNVKAARLEEARALLDRYGLIDTTTAQPEGPGRPRRVTYARPYEENESTKKSGVT